VIRAVVDPVRPVVTVLQLDVRDGSVHRWTFHTDGSGWWAVGPDGAWTGESGALRTALRASEALVPLPWCAMVVDAHPHTDEVLAELSVTLAGDCDRTVLDAQWHEDAEFAFEGNTEFWWNHAAMLDSLRPVVVDNHECAVVDSGAAGPAALLFIYDLGDMMATHVWFHDHWMNLEITTRHEQYVKRCGELAPGCFGVEHTASDHQIDIKLWPDLPVDDREVEAAFGRFLESAIGTRSLADAEHIMTDGSGRWLKGSVDGPDGALGFEGNVYGPFVALLQQHVSAWEERRGRAGSK
jgi:hypothetical protein